MEHYEIHSLLEKYDLHLAAAQEKLLAAFVADVCARNRLYNLTGRREEKDIAEDLVCRSIAPLKNLNVPHGTWAADMGTGAGAPGIPLAAVFPEINWTLFDSSAKKTSFVKAFARRKNLANVLTVTGRIEELAAHFKDAFDLAVSRAMAEAYICAELGAPLLRKGGLLYLYSNADALSAGVLSHCEACGLSLCGNEKRRELGINSEGLLFEKTIEGGALPRRFSAIKRGAINSRG